MTTSNIPDAVQEGLKGVAIHHTMHRHEGFAETAATLHRIVRYAIEKFPGRKRSLYLDIEGHRNAVGGYDQDAFKIQKDFLLDTLAPYMTEIDVPLLGNIKNSGAQSDDLAPELRLEGK